MDNFFEISFDNFGLGHHEQRGPILEGVNVAWREMEQNGYSIYANGDVNLRNALISQTVSDLCLSKEIKELN